LIPLFLLSIIIPDCSPHVFARLASLYGIGTSVRNNSINRVMSVVTVI
jgi:hypothetical protein